MADKIIDIEELAQDQHNFNKGTEQGQELMERSFSDTKRKGMATYAEIQRNLQNGSIIRIG